MKNITRKIGSYLGADEKRKAAVRVLAFVVVFITTYSLVLPAITMTKEDLDKEIDGVEVSVEAGVGALPYDASLKLAEVLLPDEEYEPEDDDAEEPRRLTDGELDLILEAALDGSRTQEAKLLKVMDISLMWNGDEIEPSRAVRLILKSDLIGEANDPVFVHLNDNGEAELVELDSLRGSELKWIIEGKEEEPEETEDPEENEESEPTPTPTPTPEPTPTPTPKPEPTPTPTPEPTPTPAPMPEPESESDPEPPTEGDSAGNSLSAMVDSFSVYAIVDLLPLEREQDVGAAGSDGKPDGEATVVDPVQAFLDAFEELAAAMSENDPDMEQVKAFLARCNKLYKALPEDERGLDDVQIAFQQLSYFGLMMPLDEEAEEEPSGDSAVTITKESDKTKVRVGETVNYTVRINNTGETDVTVDFSDDLAGGQLALPVGGLYVDGEAALRKDAVETDIGFRLRDALTIGPGGEVTVTYSAVVKEVSVGKMLTNTATATVDGTSYTAFADVTVEETTLSVEIKDNIAKGDDGKKTVNIGDEVTYTVAIENTGRESMDITFSSDLAGGQMNLVSNTVTIDGEEVSTEKITVLETGFALDENLMITPGTSTTVMYTAIVNGTASAGNPLTNTVTITEVETGFLYTFPYAEISVGANTGLEITKIADKVWAMPGEEVLYTVTVKNNDDEDVSVYFSDDLAGGRLALKEDSLRVNADTFEVEVKGEGFSLKQPFNVVGGSTVTVGYTATVPGNADEGTEFTNTATATVGEAEHKADCKITIKNITAQISEEHLAKEGYLEAVLYEKGEPMIMAEGTTYTYTWYKIPCTLVPKLSGFKELREGEPVQIQQPTTTNKELYAFTGNEAVVEAPNKYYVEVTWEEDGNSVTVRSADYQAHYYTELQNGSFETPIVVGTDSSNWHYIIVYAKDGIYSQKVPSENGGETVDGDVGSILDFAWQSTTDNFELFDVWSYGDDDTYFHLINNQSIPDGNQAAEVNADDEGTLYQAILTQPGTVIHWGLSHRGRSGEDTVGVYIGGNDPRISDISNDYVADYTTGNDRWWFYSGEYEAPAGQYVTYFSLRAIKAKANDGNGKLTIGNLVDHVQATTKSIQYPPVGIPFDYWIVKYVNPYEYVEDGIKKEAGQDWEGQFTFEVELTKGNSQAVFIYDDGVRKTFTKQTMTLTSWAQEFPAQIRNIMITDPGTYEFTIREVKTEGYGCDTGMYTIVVEVEPDIEGNGGLRQEVTYFKDGEAITEDDLVNGNAFRFNNYNWYDFTKENDKDIVWIGEEVHYTAKFKNITADPGRYVEFSDDLANGQLTLLPDTVTLDLDDGNGPVAVETVEDGTGFRLKDPFYVPLSKTATITYTAIVNENAVPGEPVINIAKVLEGENVLTDTATVKVIGLRLKKVDGNEEPLGGVKFELSSDERSDEDTEFWQLETDGDGIVDISKLKLEMGKTYYLKEAQTQDGYVLMTDVLEIAIGKDGEITLVSGGGNTLTQDEKGVYTLTVINHAGQALPQTGGESTRVYTLIGLSLMLGASCAGLLVMEKRRRGRA